MNPIPFVSVLLLPLALVFGCALSKLDKFKEHGAKVVGSKTDSGLIQYGILTNGKIGYLALTITKKEKRELQGMVTVEINGPYITTPDGAIIKLPGPDQLFENIDGKFSSAKLELSEQTLKEFLESKPEEYSIRKIIEFARVP